MNSEITHALLDIDDTLSPWEKPYIKAYPAMSKALSEASNLPEEQIIQEIYTVNAHRNNIEYSALIQEMESFKHLSDDEQIRLIKIAQKSRREAIKGLTDAFPHVDVLLTRLRTSNLTRLALSDAPKHLAYLRLKRANLLRYIDQIIARPSPPDELFHEQFRMSNKKYSVPLVETQLPKPHTDLETLLGIPFEQIRRNYFMIGNSEHSDVGLAKKFGMLCYHTHWNQSEPGSGQILDKYAPPMALRNNLGTKAGEGEKIHPNFEKVDVHSPLEIIADLEKRGILKSSS